MKTFIINLERSVERREHILEEVEKHGLDYELVKGVDGRTLSDEDLQRLCYTGTDLADERMNRAMTRPIFGCALSHLSVYEKMLAENVDMAFVLEDDALLPGDIRQLLQGIEENIRENEVISLFYWMRPQSEMKLSRQIASSLPGGYRLMYPLEPPFGAVGYVITREAARSLSKIILPVRIEADHWWYFYKNGGFQSFRCVYPMPLYLSFAETTNEPSKNMPLTAKVRNFIFKSKPPLLYQFADKLRRLKSKYYSIKLVDEPSPITLKNS